MKYAASFVILAVSALVTSPAVADAPTAESATPARSISTQLDSAGAKETILLVSLDDGSVIMQTIRSTADVCFKSASRSSTTCFTRGAPIVDPATDATIGFEMIEDQIDLVAKQD